jgi:hypothetical protein
MPCCPWGLVIAVAQQTRVRKPASVGTSLTVREGLRCSVGNGQSNSDGNSGSYSTRNRESNGQSCGESNEDSNSGGDLDRNGQSDR